MAELKSKKHERFCYEYVQDYNATAAALRAGYKESNARAQGSALLTKPDILARVHELQQEICKRLGVSAEMVIIETLKTYRECKSPTPCLQRNEKTGKYEEVGVYAFDSKGALKALDMLGKCTGLFDKKHDPNAGGKNNLMEQILAASGKDVNTDDIPELQQAPASGDDLVEQAGTEKI